MAAHVPTCMEWCGNGAGSMLCSHGCWMAFGGQVALDRETVSLTEALQPLLQVKRGGPWPGLSRRTVPLGARHEVDMLQLAACCLSSLNHVCEH